MASTPRDTSHQPKNPICQSADESVKIICDRHGQNTTLECYFSHAQRKEVYLAAVEKWIKWTWVGGQTGGRVMYLSVSGKESSK